MIWISNSIRNVDAAHLRRFSYAMNMELPDETVQARIWDFSAKKHKVTLPKERVDELVRSFDIKAQTWKVGDSRWRARLLFRRGPKKFAG